MLPASHCAGSTAGAGSGEFHTYRGYARRETARLKYIETKATRDEAEQAFQARVRARERPWGAHDAPQTLAAPIHVRVTGSARRPGEDEERLAKKRAKRQVRGRAACDHRSGG